MGGGGKGDSGLDQGVAQQWYDVHYQQGLAGEQFSSTSPDIAQYGTYGQEGWNAGNAAFQAQQEQLQLQTMMDSLTQEGQQGPTQAEMMMASAAQQSAMMDAQMEKAAKQAGMRERDAVLEGYMDAASAASDFVTSEIERERSNAKLLGIDYEVTDDMRTNRINDYFATIWGEGDQSRADRLIEQYGAPENFEGFTVTRGDAGTYAGRAEPTGEQQVAFARGARPATLATNEDQVLGGSSTILGV